MLNIQVGHSYFLSYDRKQWERGKPYPPLATIQVASLLREMGHIASLFDAMLADGVEDYQASLQTARPDVVVIYEDNFNYLTKMCLGRMREAACQMIAEARAHGARVVVAGSDASDHPDAFLAAGADAVLIGEGIAALVELIERLDHDPEIDAQDWASGIAGIATLVSGQTQLMRLGAQRLDLQSAGIVGGQLARHHGDAVDQVVGRLCVEAAGGDQIVDRLLAGPVEGVQARVDRLGVRAGYVSCDRPKQIPLRPCFDGERESA